MQAMTNRRNSLYTIGALAGGATLAIGGLRGLLMGSDAKAATEQANFPVSHTDAEWKARLTPAQYDVLRHEGTERPGSSPLNHEKRAGKFACAGCHLPTFSSETKFDSGTGWPSFWQPIAGAIDERADNSLLFKRTEVVCHQCGGHLGHVFKDGPKPTGLRYCINGVALEFQSA